jgi:hypothetical protein
MNLPQHTQIFALFEIRTMRICSNNTNFISLRIFKSLHLSFQKKIKMIKIIIINKIIIIIIIIIINNTD